MERQPVTSSTITSIGYSEESSQLEVEFTSGKIYIYNDVSHHIYNQLMTAASIGTAFNYLIRESGYSYKKLKNA
jgi:hypothetical protein